MTYTTGSTSSFLLTVILTSLYFNIWLHFLTILTYFILHITKKRVNIDEEHLAPCKWKSNSKISGPALACAAQLVEHRLAKPKVAGWIPGQGSQGTRQGYRINQDAAHKRGNLWVFSLAHQCLPPCSLPSPL